MYLGIIDLQMRFGRNDFLVPLVQLVANGQRCRSKQVGTLVYYSDMQLTWPMVEMKGLR